MERGKSDRNQSRVVCLLTSLLISSDLCSALSALSAADSHLSSNNLSLSIRVPYLSNFGPLLPLSLTITIQAHSFFSRRFSLSLSLLLLVILDTTLYLSYTSDPLPSFALLLPLFYSAQRNLLLLLPVFTLAPPHAVLCPLHTLRRHPLYLCSPSPPQL